VTNFSDDGGTASYQVRYCARPCNVTGAAKLGDLDLTRWKDVAQREVAGRLIVADQQLCRG
jgi:hypothetical protein